MSARADNWLATRTSLLSRLRDWRDEESWRDFFEVYGKLIFRVALKSGLKEEEAEDVVQDTVVTVAKHIRHFRYDRSRGSFKSWLLTITRSRIVDRVRKSRREPAQPFPRRDTSEHTAAIERVPDPASINPGLIWEEEWRRNLVEAATARIKHRVDPKHFQVFDCFVRKEWSAAQVADRLQVKPEQVYVIKHRMTESIKREVDRLEADIL